MLLDRALLKRGVDAIVESAGFYDGGAPACTTMSAFGSEIGLDLSFHESRTVDAYMLADARLVLAMERRHARDLMVSFDAGFERMFTVGGLIAQASSMPPIGEGLDVWLERLAPCRTHAEFLGVQCEDDVSDPHGESKRIHRRAFDHLQFAMDRVADIVVGACEGSR
jgi:protein-tyrosine-phosphatase